jgi:hypothetical protein
MDLIHFSGMLVILLAFFAILIAMTRGLRLLLTRSPSPAIALSPLLYDDQFEICYVRIDNIGKSEAVPMVFVTDMTDTLDRTLPGFRRSMEAHWRDVGPMCRPLLAHKGSWATAGVLAISHNKEHRELTGLSVPQIDHGIQDVIDPLDIAERRPVRISLRATCQAPDRREGNTIVRRFELTPVPDSEAYKIRELFVGMPAMSQGELAEQSGYHTLPNS